MAQLESHKDEITAKGLRIIAVGLGEPKHARRYCDKLAPSITCYSNKTPELNHEYGLTQGGLGQLLSPSVLAASTRAMRAGHHQGQATGDVKMLPGTFIVDQEGIIQYAYYSSHAGDHPDLSKLMRGVKVTAL